MSSSPASQVQKINGSNIVNPARADIMTLDHQQRFFTGWGNEPRGGAEDLKTPALGLAWTNQIAARIVLKMEGSKAIGQMSTGPEDYPGGNIWRDRKRRRYVSLVFSPWAGGKLTPVEFEIRKEGLVSVNSSK